MLNKLLKLVILIFMIIGICYGVSITIKREIPKYDQKESEIKILNMMQTKSAEATKIYTYGKSLNVDGKISNVSKDNFESVRLYITDGLDYEKSYELNYSFEENNLNFSSGLINSGIILDELDSKEYYIFLRLKLNNSINPKYYSFINSSESGKIEYYTLTENNENKKAIIDFYEKDYNNKKYNLLKISLEKSKLPEDVYDIVIDAGHGGKDSGEKLGTITEANVALEDFSTTNMYDSNGRISIACRSKAKLMISFHINNDANSGLRGIEIYSPSKSDLTFVSEMANKINESSTIAFSNNNSFKHSDGVYVRNYTNSVIKELENTANKRGYAPYSITLDTPYLYTIREVGGIATGAYVDGRNTSYSANEYYKSNQGIECYQVELGYIKNDLDIIINEKSQIVQAISEAIKTKY